MTEPIVIRGGHVIDGSGSPGRDTDIAIEDGRILEIGDDIATSGAEIIDATNRVVAPGFIDIKTHSDWTLPLMPEAESKIRQGVTTEVVGNCGFSVAPALPAKVEELRRYLSGSAPWLPFEETNFADYMDAWPEVAVNTVMQVGHNTLRLMATGGRLKTTNFATCRRCWKKAWRRGRWVSHPVSLLHPVVTVSPRSFGRWGPS